MPWYLFAAQQLGCALLNALTLAEVVLLKAWQHDDWAPHTLAEPSSHIFLLVPLSLKQSLYSKDYILQLIETAGQKPCKRLLEMLAVFSCSIVSKTTCCLGVEQNLCLKKS